mgnify:CR=1 FL=1
MLSMQLGVSIKWTPGLLIIIIMVEPHGVKEGGVNMKQS